MSETLLGWSLAGWLFGSPGRADRASDARAYHPPLSTPQDARHESVDTASVALAAAIRAGDHDAFTTIVTLYYERVVRMAWSVLRSQDLARDVAQEVFVRLWERRGTLDTSQLTAAYVLTTAYHRALDELKHHRVRDRHRDAVVLQRDEQGTAGPTGRNENEDALVARVTVDAALAALPDRWRLAIQLRFQEQRPVAELAAALGMTPNAAHQLLHRAMAALRRRLIPPGEEPGA